MVHFHGGSFTCERHSAEKSHRSLELLCASEGTLSRWSRLHLQSLAPTNPHWARVAPLPPQPWPGIREAIDHGPVCPQFDMTTLSINEGNEDCLFLNVYTKSLEPSSRLPVIFYIHGGAFMSGSGNDELLGPRFLLQHNVILVTINYRLETLGFLCLDTPEVPGNAGMKDQVAALRWVQENIEQFGGDPKNVTIYGESAGAASVTYHLMSPMSKDLFHKAIAHSGVCTNDWAKGVNDRERAFKVGKVLGKKTNDPHELLEFLQGVPAVKLIALTRKVRTDDETIRCLPIHFVPVVEKKFENIESFISEEPLDIILAKKHNDVPLLIGYNSHEGLINLKLMIKNAEIINSNFHYLVPREMVPKLTQSQLNLFGERIKDFYFKDVLITEENSEKYLTDYHFAVCILRFAYFYAASKQPTFFYKFCMESELNKFKDLIGYGHIKGTCHADDLFYLFDNMLNKSIYEEQQKAKELVFKTTKLWTDFAKTGNPTPDNHFEVKWPPYTRAKKESLIISDQLTPVLYPDRERHEFWNKLYCEAGMLSFTKSNL
ncbi:hypothetical protein evm_008774 [Chilo suppressalis]|nr:hypothetical protein evm_008774 [Chilo suppressalis]